MTRTEARQVARRLDRNGFSFIRIIENFGDPSIVVSARNRCFMERTVETLGDANDLLRSEGAGR